MKIKVELNSNSIQQTKKKLNYIKKMYQSGALINEFLEGACEWIVNRANEKINSADLGENVKIDIRNGWEFEISKTKAKIINRTEKAVFVEFGVGLRGFDEPHPSADEEGYEYNVDSGSKDENGVWYFYTNREDLDLPMKALNTGSKTFSSDKRGRMFVATSGASGVMYAYNALIDASNDLHNPTGELAKMWRNLQEKYIGRYLK